MYKRQKTSVMECRGDTLIARSVPFYLSDIGKIVSDEIIRVSSIYNNVTVDKSIVMANHIHMIILIACEQNGRPQDAPTISRIIQQFKGSISKQAGFPVWQKSFYEHIIRNEQDYLEIWEYIDTNPHKWREDEYYSASQSG